MYRTYQVGKILKYTLDVYQDEIAGKPNIPISTTKTRRSNADKTMSRLTNDGAKSSLDRSLTKKHTLKMFTSTPSNETSDKFQLKMCHNQLMRYVA